MSSSQPSTTLVELYERSISNYANNQLFGVKKNGRYSWITYSEFGKSVDAFRGGLAALDVGKGDTVAIIADNRVEWAVAAYGTYGRAASFCPMYESQLEKDWEYILSDSGTKVVIVANDEIYQQVKPMCAKIDTLEHVIFLDGDDSHEDSYASLLAAGKAAPSPTEHPTPQDLAGFIYTSGTTGKPKGVLLSHENICFNVAGVLDINLIETTDVSLAFLPWAHSFGQNCELHVMFALGASMGLVESVQTIIANLSEVRPTALFAVPRIFNRIYDGLNKRMEEESPVKRKLFEAAMKNSDDLRAQVAANKTSLKTTMLDKAYDAIIFKKVRERFGGRLRFCISGGAALSPEVARFIDNLHIHVFEGYGLTETSPLVTVNLPGARKIGCVGKPIRGVEVVIKDVEGYPKGSGEVCVRGKNVMIGYHELPDKTAEVIDEEANGGRLFHTGDLGRLDEDGFLWIIGRVKEQYKLENGKYVVPAPIEEQLSLSPYILQCMIEGIGKPYNAAVIIIDKESMTKWAKDNSVPEGELLTHKKVHALIDAEIKRVGSELKGYERPRKFVLDDEEWTPDNGMLTPKMSLKRRIVMKKYGDDLEALYK
jgi:long-chain acyl-CoA synthetase